MAKRLRCKAYRSAKKKLWKADPFCGWCCRLLYWDEATLDHIQPLARGGLNEMSNYCLACQHCNSTRLRGKNKIKRNTAIDWSRMQPPCVLVYSTNDAGAES